MAFTLFFLCQIILSVTLFSLFFIRKLLTHLEGMFSLSEKTLFNEILRFSCYYSLFQIVMNLSLLSVVVPVFLLKLYPTSSKERGCWRGIGW